MDLHRALFFLTVLNVIMKIQFYFLLISVLCGQFLNAQDSPVQISEFLAINQTILEDSDGSYPDWIELHNIDDKAQSLQGWYLTDDPDRLTRWQLPDITINAGEYQVIYASGKDRRTSPEYHTNFKLDGDGEYLALVYPDGQNIAMNYAPQFPRQYPDVSFGLYENNQVYFQTPTPGQPNVYSPTDFLPAPAFDHSHGFYDEPFLLQIEAEADAEIRYTLDGSEPTDRTGIEYADAIEISTTTIVRAIAIKDGYAPSPVATHTFLFVEDVKDQSNQQYDFPEFWGDDPRTAADYELDPEIINDPAYRDKIPEALLSLPSLSLSMDVYDWFDPVDGIYANAAETGDEWERAVSAEFLYPEAIQDNFSVNCGVRIQGGSSVYNWKSPKLSMRLRFSSDFGPTTLDIPLFPDSEIESINTLILDARLNMSWIHPSSEEQRSGAQYIRDQYMNDLQNEMGWLSPHGFYVNLYINGLYWGLYCIHERPDEAFMAEYLEGSRDDFDVIRHDHENIVNGSNDDWMRLFEIARQGLRPADRYNLVGTYLDIPAFIDYMILNYWAGNTDWDHHNWYAGRNRNDGSGFRIYSWDAEHVLKDVNHNVTDTRRDYSPTEMHYLLSVNADYRESFKQHVDLFFKEGGVLSPQKATELYRKRLDEIDPAIILESARWGDYREAVSGQTYERDDQWVAERDRLLNDYFPRRTDIVLDQFKDKGWYSENNTPGGGDSSRVYRPPTTGWTYEYGGDQASAAELAALDGTWSHDNGSDEWDGSDLSGGAPGGAMVLQEGDVSYLRLQDTGDPRIYNVSEPSNRKLYFTHSPADQNDLDSGVTLTFRARLATEGPLDKIFLTPQKTTWPAQGKGYLVHDGGKGNVTVHWSEGGTISFCLAHGDEDDKLEKSGLVMNKLNGNSVSDDVDLLGDSQEGTFNVLACQPAQWHEFWITLEPDASRTGTHRATIYREGQLDGTPFLVTAGNGSDADGHYLGLGVGSTPQHGALDIDFLAYSPGIFQPQLQTGSSETEKIPTSATLYQNYPNPFNGVTTITYDLASEGNVSVRIYSALGKKVVALVDQIQPLGSHHLTVDGNEWGNGVYFYRLWLNGQLISTRKMVLLK